MDQDIEALLKRKGGRAQDVLDDHRYRLRLKQLASTNVSPSSADLERMIGANDLVDVNFLERGLVATRSVGRILLGAASGRTQGYATGFMISPSLLITNTHVFGTGSDAEDALVEFDYEYDIHGVPKPTERFRFAPREYFYAHPTLDFAIVAVDPRPLFQRRALDKYGWLRLDPRIGKVNELEWVSIIQHPGGEMKQLAIRENQLLEIREHTLWYASDTAPGSSGAPVFNDAWQVVAVHHAGVPATDSQGRRLGPDGSPAPANASEAQIKWIANEGVRVSVIVRELEQRAPRSAKLIELFDLIAEEMPTAPVTLVA